ncbi:MAG: hypothetical protein QOH67_1821 [Hyphomicrobiales bacterium]|jgi:hypothetical protein|nr:hypothetical protein [Hyphomicrobiales bacterium]
MEWGQARTLLTSLFSRERESALSRRDMLAGIGLAGLFVTAVKVLPPSVADAATLTPAAPPEPGTADATQPKATEQGAIEGNADGDVTDLSARRRWRRRYWRRRWRRRYWGRRRYWRRRWRRRYW